MIYDHTNIYIRSQVFFKKNHKLHVKFKLTRINWDRKSSLIRKIKILSQTSPNFVFITSVEVVKGHL